MRASVVDHVSRQASLALFLLPLFHQIRGISDGSVITLFVLKIRGISDGSVITLFVLNFAEKLSMARELLFFEKNFPKN